MDKERVIKSMRDAIEANKHIREQTNNALSHGIGLLEKQDGEYEKGANDAWIFVNKLHNTHYYERDMIFGVCSINNIVKTYTFSDAVKKYNEYEKKKEEEAAKPKLGDVVEVYNDINFKEKGIYLSGDSNGFVYLTTNGTVMSVGGCYVNFRKTDEHVDIQGMLDKIG